MIESLQIERFRCFERMRLESLARVNVIVGDSGSGKTALLEAIYLAASANPQVLFSLRRWRGAGAQTGLSQNREAFEGLWADLYYNFDSDKPVSITLRGSPDNTRSV